MSMTCQTSYGIEYQNRGLWLRFGGRYSTSMEATDRARHLLQTIAFDGVPVRIVKEHVCTTVIVLDQVGHAADGDR